MTYICHDHANDVPDILKDVQAGLVLTYTKVIRQTADAFEEAKKAAEGYLSPLDEINRYSSKQ